MSPTQRAPDVARVDAFDKVRGATVFGTDQHRPNLAHAMLAVSQITRGRIVSIDTAAARAVPGVRLLITHDDATGVQSGGYRNSGGFAFQSVQPLLTAEIAHRGQPIALVVADTLEAAVQAAALVRARYEEAPFIPTIDTPGAETVPQPRAQHRIAGDADAALASADVVVDARYVTPPQHQNPIELIGTLAEWTDGTLTVYEGTQNANGIQHGLARQLRLAPEEVRVVSPYTGGAFGQKNTLQLHTAFVAYAARRLGRPVKLVIPRAQLFHDTGFRPASRQRVRLGADRRSGRIVSAIQEVEHQTSRHDSAWTASTEMTPRLHGIANFRGVENLVRTDHQTPGYMRAPFEHQGAFGFECAMDELAYALGRDPVALRLANDTTTDPLTGKPLSSRHLAECLRRGAERFGWARRTMAPGSMRERDGTLVGWGVAAGAYKASTSPVVARLRVTDDGGVTISLGVHEMGQGARTVVATAVAEALSVPIGDVRTLLGDTRGTPQHVTAGSWGTASAVPAAQKAAAAMREALRQLNTPGGGDRFPREILREANRSSLAVEALFRAQGQPDSVYGRLSQGLPAAVGPEYPEFVSFSYVAHFVEVRVEPSTGRVRVPRVVSVVDCGRVMSPRTARSQVLGAVVWGIGASLREVSEVDPRFGGFLNADLAEYVIPVNADIGDIQVDFIDVPDPLLNSAGVKGVGEVAMVGVAPAIVNAIHHATGRRIRHLPVRIEDLLP